MIRTKTGPLDYDAAEFAEIILLHEENEKIMMIMMMKLTRRGY